MAAIARVLLCCICIAVLNSEHATRLYHKIRRTNIYAPIHRRVFDFDRIDEHVLLGRQPRNEADVRALRDNRVSAVLCLTQPWELYVPPEMYRTYSLERLALPTCDFGAPTMEQLRLGLSFIHEHRSRGQSVYIHCNAGKGRSGVMAVAYYLSEYVDRRQSAYAMASEATREVRMRRPALSSLLDYYPLTAQARIVRTFATRVRLPA